MKPLDYVKKIAIGSCIYYTGATFLLLFIYFLFNRSLDRGMQVLPLVSILPFSLFFSAANTVYRHTLLARWLRLIIHYTLTVGGCFVFLYLPNRAPEQSAANGFTMFLVFTVTYLVIMSIVLLVSARIHRVKRDEAKYHNVYKK